MKPLLLHIRPLNTTTSERVDCRVADALNTEAYGAGGLQWRAAMTQRPQVNVELMSLDLDGRVLPSRMSVAINTRELGPLTLWQNLKWTGAPITLYSMEDYNYTGRRIEFSGEITQQRLDLGNGDLRLQCQVSTRQLERNLLHASFDGSGGLGGEADVRGALMPAGFGKVDGIEPVWFDKTRWIGMLDGYANTISIDKLMEGAMSFGASQGDYPDYDALAAAIDAKDVAPGQWATCVAYGLVGLGAPPYKPIGVNATFGGNRLGAIIKDIAELHALFPLEQIDTEALDALDEAVPYDVHLWTREQREVKQVIEALAASANATPLLLPNNTLSVTRAASITPAAVLRRDGSTKPRVVDWAIAGAVPPYWQIKARAARPARVLTFDEVNYEDDIIDRGAYDPTVTYRAGHVVWKADKSSYLYIAEEATAGNPLPVAPDTSTAYWQQMTPPATAGDLSYSDGSSIEFLRPAAPGSQPNSLIGVTAGTLNGIGAGDGTPVDNTNITISADGTIVGGGGGQVTIGGLGFTGETDADKTVLSPEGPRSEEFHYAADGTAEAGELPRNLVYTLSLLDGVITSGLVWTYRVKSGSVNGNEPGATEYAMSGAGAGTFTVNSLEAESAIVEIKANQSGKIAVAEVTLTKKFAAPNNTGEVDLNQASQGSGFTIFNTGSFSAITAPLRVTALSSEAKMTAVLSARPVDVPFSSSETFTTEAKVQMRINGGAWADVGAVDTAGSSAYWDGDFYGKMPALLSLVRTLAVSPGDVVEGRVVARITGGALRDFASLGRVTLEA